MQPVVVKSVSFILLCDPMDCSTPGFPVLHDLPEFAHTHVHQVSNAIQPSHPPSPPSLPTFNLSQHQGPFQWVSSSPPVAEVLELQLQHQSIQWILRADFLWDGLVGSPYSPRDSQESSPVPQLESLRIRISLNWPSLRFFHSGTFPEPVFVFYDTDILEDCGHPLPSFYNKPFLGVSRLDVSKGLDSGDLCWNTAKRRLFFTRLSPPEAPMSTRFSLRIWILARLLDGTSTVSSRVWSHARG